MARIKINNQNLPKRKIRDFEGRAQSMEAREYVTRNDDMQVDNGLSWR